MKTQTTLPKTETVASEPQDDRPISASLTDVSKDFALKGRQVEALKAINLSIYKGEYVVILGPSGCGKSTLVRCIAGLETPTGGEITLAGQPVYNAQRSINTSIHKRQVGMVFQNYALWPHMSVERNIAYPLKMRHVPKGDRPARVAEVLSKLECEHLAKRLPAELSGGQQQRIALARALVYQPGLLLLDEPLSNLDALLRVSLRSELLRLHRTLGFTGLHITHDQDEALEMGDRIVLMREGRIEQVGPPEEVYRAPVSPYAANFLGVRNRVEVSRNAGRLEYGQGVIAGSGALAQKVSDESAALKLFARSRDTRVARYQPGEQPSSDCLVLDGTIAQVVLGDGGRRQYVVDVGGSFWYAQHADDEGLTPGDRVHLRTQATHALLYQGETLLPS